MLNNFTIFNTHFYHDVRNALGAEQTHQVIFERHKELGSSRIALTSGTSAQLAVYPARLVAFGTNNGQTPRFFYPFA
ncbi:hypothetical protein D9M68_803380 [compost metagenome]